MNLVTLTVKRILLVVLLACLTGMPPIPGLAQRQAKDLARTYYLPVLRAIQNPAPNGPDGGSITALAFNPRQAEELFVGTWGGGVFRSADGGQSWESRSVGLQKLYIQSLAVDPLNPATLYAGTYRSGIYKSTDGGKTWAAASNGLNRDAIVYDLAIDPKTPSTLYAGTRSPGSTPPWGGGVYKSSDGGQTWSMQNTGLGEDWVYGLAVDPNNPAILYAALHTAGLYRSGDGARTWQPANNGIGDLSGRAVIIDPANPQILYYGAWHGGGVFKSSDGGASWQAASSGLNAAKIYKLAIDPVDHQIVYAATFLTGLYRSANSGASWEPNGFSADFPTSVGVSRLAHTTIYSGLAGAGFFRSLNSGQDWNASQRGLQAAIILSIAASPSNPANVVTGLSAGGTAFTFDSGKTWQAAASGMPRQNINALAVNGSGAFIAGTASSGVLLSRDGGRTWASANSGLAALGAKSLTATRPGIADFTRTVLDEANLGSSNKALGAVSAIPTFLALAVTPTNPQVLYLGSGSNGVYKSTNGGSAWSPSGLDGKPVYALSIDPTRPNFIYACTDGPSGSLWKSKDGGLTWNIRNGGIQNLAVNSLLVDPLNADRLLAATSSGIFSSGDGGVNWQLAGLAGKITNALAFSREPLVYYAGAADGLYSSTDGLTWQPVNGTAGHDILTILPAGGGQNALRYGTRGQGSFLYFTPSSDY